MGVSDNSLLDLSHLVKFVSWIYWGKSDISSVSGEVSIADVGQTICCECGLRFSESSVGYRCQKCSRVFCEGCVRGYGSFAELDIRPCKFCAGFESKQKFGGKFSHKIHPCDSPRQSPKLSSPDYSGERFDGSSLNSVSVCRSTSRSDEDDGEYSSKKIISPLLNEKPKARISVAPIDLDRFHRLNPLSNVFLMFLSGLLVNGPYALITTAVAADLGTQSSIKGNSRALATVSAIIDGTGSVGTALGPLLAGYIIYIYTRME